MSASRSGRCGPLAAWASAWITGRVSIDEVVDAVTGDDAAHRVLGLRGSAGASTSAGPSTSAELSESARPPGDAGATSLHDVLVRWRRAGTGVRVLFPVAGDVRGLPGPAQFRAAALEAGEAVVGGSPESTGGLGIVATVQVFEPSSAPASVLWHSFETEPPPPDHLDVADAQYELATAIRETASALAAADVAANAHPQALRDARHAGEGLDLPRDFPQRAVALLAQAERMQAVLDLALADPVGGAVDRFGMSSRDAALRPLTLAVRRARLAGYNAESPL